MIQTNIKPELPTFRDFGAYGGATLSKIFEKEANGPTIETNWKVGSRMSFASYFGRRDVERGGMWYESYKYRN